MVYSAGILLYRLRENTNEVEFFMCTPGGPLWKHRESWNLPKGMIDENETPEHAALREFTEETNINLYNPDTIKLLSLVKQSSAKSVYVYIKRWEGEDTSNCKSNTFTWKDSKEYPEIGKYAWLTYNEIVNRGGVKAYYDLFKSIKN